MRIYRRQGFTVIELIIVISIIAVLIALIFPIFSSALEKAHQTTCMNNVHQIAISIQIYANDNDNTFPNGTTVWQMLQVPNKALVCPTIGKKLPNGYGYNYSLSNRLIAEAENVTNPAKIVTVADCRINASLPNLISKPNDIDFRHNGTAIFGFLDGHVNSLKTCPQLSLFTMIDLADSWLPIPTNQAWGYDPQHDGPLEDIYPGWTTNQITGMSLWNWDGIGKEYNTKPLSYINLACTDYSGDGTIQYSHNRSLAITIFTGRSAIS